MMIMTMMILPLRHTTLNLPNDIHGACADLWVFTTNGDAGRKRAVDTENHSLSLRRQNGHVTVYPGMITSERKKARLKKHLSLAPTFNRLMPLKDRDGEFRIVQVHQREIIFLEQQDLSNSKSVSNYGEKRSIR